MGAKTILSSQDVQELCQRYFAEKDPQDHNKKDKSNKSNVAFTVLQYELKPTSDEPSGFFGCHQFLCIKIQHDNSNRSADANIEQLCFFTKTAPIEIASRMEYLEAFGVFKKEILTYRDVLPQLEHIVGSVAPKCFYADKNMLVFENLAEHGFKMSATRDGLLDYEHLKCAVKTLAAMHAGSIIFEVRAGKKLPEIHKIALTENCYPLNVSDEHMRMQNFNNATRVFCEMLKMLPKYQNDNLNHILAEFPRQMRKIFELAQPSKRYHNVFSHGDLWANNLMYRYEQNSNVPIECRFVDFQLVRYAPPMLDLVTILTIPTSREFRDRYLSKLVTDYYRFISEYLQHENLSVEKFLPKNEFFTSIAEFRSCGIVESLLFSHLTILPPKLTLQLTTSTDGFSDFFARKRVEICMEAFNIDQIYRERLTDMLEDLVDNFVLTSK